MDRLTPNLWAYSTFSGTPPTLETRQLDFNLARRSGIIINKVIGQAFLVVNTTSGHGVSMGVIQEVDTDPDNITIEFAGLMVPDDVVLDSSRVFRQRLHVDRETAAGVESATHTSLIKDWSQEPEHKRPISITPLRHHVNTESDIASFYRVEVNIDYFIVELSLEEIGIINASRR